MPRKYGHGETGAIPIAVLFVAWLALARLAVVAAGAPHWAAEELRLLVHLLEAVAAPRLGHRLGVGRPLLRLRPGLAAPRLARLSRLALPEALTLPALGVPGPLVAAEGPLRPVLPLRPI